MALRTTRLRGKERELVKVLNHPVVGTIQRYSHLGELRGSSASHLGHTQVEELVLELIQLLGQLLLVLRPQLGALNLHLRGKKSTKI